MKIAVFLQDFREDRRDYQQAQPYFAPGSTSLFQGFMQKDGLEVHVVCCTQRPVTVPEKLAPNIWFHSLLVPKIGWLRTGYQGCIRAVRRQLREVGPDVVHGIGTERDGAISAVFSGYPNVITMAGNMAELARLNRPRFGTYLWVVARLENFILPRAGGVICNSRYTERLVRNRARKTWVVYPALRNAFLEPLPDGTRPCVLLNAGVISPRKRQLELLDVAEKLHRQGLKFEFHFIGLIPPADPYAAAFLKRIKPMEAGGYARYLGQLPEARLAPCFDSVAGLVHFPTEEAFGSSACEALARNLKFFGARTGGIVEIAEGVPGAELFAPDDWPGLTEAIARWVKAGHPCPSGAADIMRQRYHPDVYLRQHLQVYQEVLSARKR